MVIGLGLGIIVAAPHAPKNIPITNIRFHVSLFQSYWKNGILAGTHAAHICLSVDEIPNGLLPKINKVGTTNPIKGPATYQAHGCLRNCNMVFVLNGVSEY